MLRVASLLLAMFLGLALAEGTYATEPKQISWDDLIPATEPIDDPFTKLTPDQLRDLRAVITIVELFKGSEVPPHIMEKVNAARERLTAQKVDIDYLSQQRDVVRRYRQQQATAVNSAIIGSEVRMPGYMLPLELDGRKVVEFLLVPTVGACIHTPPPPPNQIIHVIYPDGIEASSLYTPLWIRGSLTGESSEQSVSYSDGQTGVAVSYRMTAISVEPY